MFISIQELEQQVFNFQESIPPGKINLGPELVQKAKLETQGRAELIEEHHGPKQIIQDIRLVGDFSTQVETRCARCLEAVPLSLAEQFDLLYRPHGSVAARDEISITEADTEVGFYRGDGLELEDVLKEQVLLAVPLRALCREDCKGICAECGQNLNQRQCGCEPERNDVRWSPLADIKDRLNKQ